MDFNNKIAVVTGGAQGIGRCVAAPDDLPRGQRVEVVADGMMVVAISLFADYPSTTSITIIRTKPMAKPMVERLVWVPWAVSGMSSSTTTYIMAPAAKASR